MRKIRVLVVEDSVVMRRAIMVALAKDPALDVTASARNGAEALEMIPTVNPDVITLDIEMPVKDGLATLRELRRVRTDLPVIMFSSHTQRGAQATLLALTLGATDCVGKPANMASVADSWKCLEEELLPKVKLHGEHSIQRGERTARVAAPPAPIVNGVPGRSRLVSAICVGVSAGGPNALVRIFSQLTDPLPVPVLLVQHMPAMFTRMLAERLTSVSQMQFHEAEEGMPVEAGRGYLAPGGKHMTVAQRAAVSNHQHHGGLRGILHGRLRRRRGAVRSTTAPDHEHCVAFVVVAHARVRKWICAGVLPPIPAGKQSEYSALRASTRLSIFFNDRREPRLEGCPGDLLVDKFPLDYQPRSQ